MFYHCQDSRTVVSIPLGNFRKALPSAPPRVATTSCFIILLCQQSVCLDFWADAAGVGDSSVKPCLQRPPPKFYRGSLAEW